MPQLIIRSRVLLVVAALLILPGCQTVKGWFGMGKSQETETLPVEQLYAEARDARDKENYSRAARYYERLIARFPFGPYTEQSQLDLAYSQYKTGKYEDATSTVDRFIRTYPTHKSIDYAYYLRGLINFNRENFFLQKIARADMSGRELDTPKQSFQDFAELLRRYPNSVYALDARQRMIYLQNVLARHEMNTGLYYYRRGAWISAINRAKHTLETYPQSEFEADGVALLAASYSRLGEEQLAADSRRVLEMNYPQHPYLSGNWPDDEGFLKRLNPFGSGR